MLGRWRRLAHRGPDGKGAERVGDAWLGHVHLAIVDLAGGGQPILAPDGAGMVGNGEIYNHRDLRATRPERSEKWLLRTAFRDWLPPELLWRDKEQFGHGTGSSEVLTAHAASRVDAAELATCRHATDPRRSRTLYLRLTVSLRPGPSPRPGPPVIRQLQGGARGGGTA